MEKSLVESSAICTDVAIGGLTLRRLNSYWISSDGTILWCSKTCETVGVYLEHLDLARAE